MKRFKDVLSVYGDGQGAEDALDQSIMLARANKARLTVVDLIDPGRHSVNAVRLRKRRLERLVPAIKAEAIEHVDTRVLVGSPFLEIIRKVLRDEHDLVIVAAEGGSVVKAVFFGSTATHLVRKCPCPVWIIKPGQSIHYGRILAAIDPKPDDPTSDRLNRKIMELATSLASMSGASLDIVHAWDVTGNDRDTLASEAPRTTHAAILEKHEKLHRDAVNSLVENHPVFELDHEVLLQRGIPERVIVELVQGRNVDLIVMGTVNRTGIPGLFIGNAAETMLEAVECGLLAVKPDGFISPVAFS